MTVTVKFENGDQLGRRFKFGVTRFGDKAIRAAQSAARTCAATIIERGKADMRAGGNFSSSRWQDGLQARISFTSRSEINIRITHAVFYWKVFEIGAVIKGKPLLWIPLSFAADAQGVRARDYPGPLFRVDRRGKAPLLLSDDGPKYFGKESVTIPKKFHLREIAAEESRNLNVYYKEAFRNG